jgi:imidazolonepropionase-like amidohydrolase
MTGTVEVGKKADLVIVDENPLANFKLLYGTGSPASESREREMERVGGVRYTVRDGIVFRREDAASGCARAGRCRQGQ